MKNLSCFFGIHMGGSRRSNASLPPPPKIFSARKKESSYLFGPLGLFKLNHKGIGVQSSTTSKAVDEIVRDDDRPGLPSPNFGIKYSPRISEATGQNNATVQERPQLDLSIPPRKENRSCIRNKHRVTLRSQAMQRIDREPWYKSLDDFWHSRDRGASRIYPFNLSWARTIVENKRRHWLGVPISCSENEGFLLKSEISWLPMRRP